MNAQTSFACLAIVLSACSEPAVHSLPLLRYDGVYHVHEFGETCYLHFYPDGLVVDACSTDPPRTIITLLNRSSRGVSHGQYRMTGSHISFSTVNPQGMVDYFGTVGRDCLFLHYHSRINNRKGTHLFTFTQSTQTREAR
jgi:hypothetical protein